MDLAQLMSNLEHAAGSGATQVGSEAVRSAKTSAEVGVRTRMGPGLRQALGSRAGEVTVYTDESASTAYAARIAAEDGARLVTGEH